MISGVNPISEKAFTMLSNLQKQCEMISGVNPISEKAFTMLSNLQKQCEMISEVQDVRNEHHNIQKFNVTDKNRLRVEID